MLNDIYQTLDPVLFSLGPFTVRWYGIAYVLGFVCAALVIWRVARRWRVRVDADSLLTIMFCVIIGVIVGGRLGYVLFYGDYDYLANPLEIIAVNHGGMSFHGGLIGALLAGQAGFIRQVQAYDEKQATDQGFKIYAAPTRGVNDSLSFRPDNPLVADLRVRQALLHATNAKQVVETLFSANYPQATSVLASSAAGYVNLSDKLTFDQAKARQLLDDAGWKPDADGIRSKDGQRLALTVYESLPQPQNKEVLQLIAQQWRQVGVALTVKAGDAGSRTLDNLDPQKTPLTVSEVGRADPDVVKSMFFPNNRDALLQKGGSSDKVQHFRDDKLNDLLTGISAAVEPQQRLQLTGDAQRYLIDNAYVIPIFEEPQVFAGAPWVKGVSFEAVGRPSFYGAWLDKH